jgi:hypothetical protein
LSPHDPQKSNLMAKIKDYNISFLVLSVMYFEMVTKKPFEIKTITDMYTYFYACLMAGKEYKGDFDTFIAWVDETPSLINEFKTLWDEHYKGD